jgi:hypothetical protein
MVERFDGPPAHERDGSSRPSAQFLKNAAELRGNHNILRCCGNIEQRAVDIEQKRRAMEINLARRKQIGGFVRKLSFHLHRLSSSIPQLSPTNMPPGGERRCQANCSAR